MTSASLLRLEQAVLEQGSSTVVEVFTVVDLLNDECLCVCVSVCECVCVCEWVCVFVITCLPSTSTLFGNYY